MIECLFLGLEYILVHYRWLVVCVGLLPVSFLFDLYMLLRAWLIFKFNSAPKKHDERVREVQRQVC